MELTIVAVIALLCVIAYQGWFIKRLTDRHDADKAELLNRIMTRSYAEYVQGAIAHKQVERELTAEEIAALREERGIPV